MSHKTYILGVDPGLDGGLAVYSFDNITQDENLVMTAMPTTPTSDSKREIDVQGVREFLSDTILGFSPEKLSLAVIEKVSARPDQGVTSMFTFGTGYGMLLGMLNWNSIAVQRVTPQSWKKIILEGTPKDKGAAIGFIHARFPTANLKKSKACRTFHDGMADAGCLALYGKYLKTGKI